MTERKFKKVVSSTTWDYKAKKEGDKLEGVLITKMPADNKISARYYIENPEGKHMVWGSASLDDYMSSVEVGEYIRITYGGKKDIGNSKTLHQFDVEKEDTSDESSDSEPAPTAQPDADSFPKKPDEKPAEELVK